MSRCADRREPVEQCLRCSPTCFRSSGLRTTLIASAFRSIQRRRVHDESGTAAAVGNTEKFFAAVLAEERKHDLPSYAHFTVYATRATARADAGAATPEDSA